MKVIDIGGEVIITATGPEATLLQECVYQRALAIEDHASGWVEQRQSDLVKKMLDAFRRPYEAIRAGRPMSRLATAAMQDHTSARKP